MTAPIFPETPACNVAATGRAMSRDVMIQRPDSRRDWLGNTTIHEDGTLNGATVFAFVPTETDFPPFRVTVRGLR